MVSNMPLDAGPSSLAELIGLQLSDLEMGTRVCQEPNLTKRAS